MHSWVAHLCRPIRSLQPSLFCTLYLNSESEALGVIEGVERDVRVLTIGGVIAVEGELSLDIHFNPFDVLSQYVNEL